MLLVSNKWSAWQTQYCTNIVREFVDLSKFLDTNIIGIAIIGMIESTNIAYLHVINTFKMRTVQIENIIIFPSSHRSIIICQHVNVLRFDFFFILFKPDSIAALKRIH